MNKINKLNAFDLFSEFNCCYYIALFDYFLYNFFHPLFAFQCVQKALKTTPQIKSYKYLSI